MCLENDRVGLERRADPQGAAAVPLRTVSSAHADLAPTSYLTRIPLNRKNEFPTDKTTDQPAPRTLWLPPLRITEIYEHGVNRWAAEQRLHLGIGPHTCHQTGEPDWTFGLPEQKRPHRTGLSERLWRQNFKGISKTLVCGEMPGSEDAEAGRHTPPAFCTSAIGCSSGQRDPRKRRSVGRIRARSPGPDSYGRCEVSERDTGAPSIRHPRLLGGV